MSEWPKTFSEAKRLNSDFYFTGKPCNNGHIGLRYKDGPCVACAKINVARSKAKDPERVKRVNKAYYEANKDRISEVAKVYAANNREAINAYRKEWKANSMTPEQKAKYAATDAAYAKKNRERIGKNLTAWREKNAEKYKKQNSEYYQANRAQFVENLATRRARMRNATPPWTSIALKSEIRSVYIEAKKLESETGIRYDVDHIVPIGARNVCGLHVPWNLRPLPKEENFRRPRSFRDPHLAFAPILGETTLLGSFTL